MIVEAATIAPMSNPLTTPGTKNDPWAGNDGFGFEESEHIVSDDDADTALCGIDQTGVPWDQGFPVCQACLAVAQGRMS
jgi:hypothetical protein